MEKARSDTRINACTEHVLLSPVLPASNRLTPFPLCTGTHLPARWQSCEQRQIPRYEYSAGLADRIGKELVGKAVPEETKALMCRHHSSHPNTPPTRSPQQPRHAAITPKGCSVCMDFFQQDELGISTQPQFPTEPTLS